jgi:hypothetical protein
MKQGSLFCFCQAEISQTTALDAVLLVFAESFFNELGGAQTWFETVWSYSVKVVDY